MIVVLRHGETAFNASRVFQPEETPLSERGKEQARLVGERLKALNIVKVISSDLSRALETALHVVGKMDRAVGVETTDLLRERSFGDFRGQSIDHVVKEFDLSKNDFTPPNGESWNTFHVRAAKAWEFIMERARVDIKSSRDVILVVTHGLVKSSFASKIWNVVPTRPFENTSVSIVSADAPHRVERLGCFEHLPDHLIDKKPVFSSSEQNTSAKVNKKNASLSSSNRL